MPIDQGGAPATTGRTAPRARSTTFFVGRLLEATGNDNTYFKGGGSKDENDIHDLGGSPTDVAPDKDELLDAFAAVYERGGDTLGLLRGRPVRQRRRRPDRLLVLPGQGRRSAATATSTASTSMATSSILSEYTNGGVVSLDLRLRVGRLGGGDNIDEPFRLRHGRDTAAT